MKTSYKILIALITAILLFIFISLLLAKKGLNITHVDSTQITKKENLSAFHSLKVQSFADIELAKGPFSIQLDGDSLAIASHEISVVDSVLQFKIETKRNVSYRAGLKITVFTDELRDVKFLGSGQLNYKDTYGGGLHRINLQGSGDIHTKYSGPFLDISILGSGFVTNEGTVDRLQLSLQGSGEINTKTTTAKNATVNLLGTGAIALHCADSLLVNLTGSGDVIYMGNPQLQINKTGHGEVIKAE
ncbi:MAG: DUF2807 domain-containing protein [Saprospiraceae bacterium]|nr:DUF2807 domain-containing protein [Saprospiraceae bacterium]